MTAITISWMRASDYRSPSDGLMKFWSTSDVGILGAAINFNAGASGFNGGHNLHKLTLSAAATYVVPVFPAAC